jgi:hypothetical protein
MSHRTICICVTASLLAVVAGLLAACSGTSPAPALTSAAQGTESRPASQSALAAPDGPELTGAQIAALDGDSGEAALVQEVIDVLRRICRQSMGLITQLAAINGDRLRDAHSRLATPHAFLLTQAKLIGEESGSAPGTYDCVKQINETMATMASGP